MNIKSAFIAILLMAFVTYFPRVLPLVVFRKEIKSNYVKSFLHYVPFAVLGALTFPDIFYSTGTFLTALFGTITALILSYFERSLVVVAIGAIIVVYFTGLIIG